MYIVLSGNAGEKPTIIQEYRTKRSAENAAEKRRKYWTAVKIVKLDSEKQIIDETMKTL